ncbi:universal stress protein [Streptomyces sp. SID14515]|uniref:universal stress protein n=1 Tax=Streptomyces sp. SID14515 TaxID=2706074 RepID=UPI0013CCFD4C|nr:universal stress protein [Streptomyces sp. SID14515]NEB41929.1 universal stress protein [Streptomyces sp. SID14515]
MIRPVVAGVDGSPESLAAADWAAREATLRGLPLRIVHAWLWQPLDVPLVQNRDAEEQAARAVLRAAEEHVTSRYPQLTVTTKVLPETPVVALTAEAERAAVLCLGTRGHGALLGFLLGSYGQQVLASAKGPVVSVRADDGEGAPRESAEVVVGQQGSPEDSADVLGFAFEAAALRGAPLRAVRAWSLPPVYTWSASLALADASGGLEPFEREALRAALAPWRERYPDVKVLEDVQLGSAGQVLVEASPQARLMVVGRRARRSPIGARIGSAAHAVLHHARCPVAVVPHA